MPLALNIYDDLKLRLGTPADMSEVMSLAIDAAKENGLVNASQLLLAKTIWPCLNQDHGIVGCIQSKKGERIEGIVVLQVGTLFYSDEPALEEKVVFVHPEYRAAKVGRARKLCEFSKSVADDLGLPLIIGVFSSVETQAKIGLYKRIFGEPAGLYFLYGGTTGNRDVKTNNNLSEVRS
jgi:GNAT superfamily N-acetyltransferase